MAEGFVLSAYEGGVHANARWVAAHRCLSKGLVDRPVEMTTRVSCESPAAW
jgi:hypothetical protein